MSDSSATQTDAVKSETESHPLKYSYSFFYMRRQQGSRSQENYEKNLKKVGSFATVEEFWAFYNHLIRPNELQSACDYQVFRAGIKPMWEDDANKDGGKFVIRAAKKKRFGNKYWEDLLLALVGEQFESSEDVCGIIASVRYHEDLFSIWIRNSEDIEARKKIEDSLRRILRLPVGYILEFKPHSEATKEPKPDKQQHDAPQ